MAELSLSTEIVNNVVEVLKKHDPATSDHLVASQYLAAIIGFIAVSYTHLTLPTNSSV